MFLDDTTALLTAESGVERADGLHAYDLAAIPQRNGPVGSPERRGQEHL
ncbi:hypothetical protein [Streptosporangium vulgare]|uniref:Uncharacterized protein n=1 Tax=Streptosporangium vulgare TaxID=46190 RepID=A0ABV5TQS0_9ACTN